MHTREKIDAVALYTTVFICLRREVYFLFVAVFFEAADFLGALAFLAAGFFAAFFAGLAGLAALLVDELAAAVDEEAPAAVPVEALAAFFGFDAPAAFFLGAAAFFFGLFAFAFPAALGFADFVDFGLAKRKANPIIPFLSSS